MKFSLKILLIVIVIFSTKQSKAQVTLDWVTQIGDSLGEEGHSIVVDNLGNSYVLGTYASGSVLDFDNGSGSTILPVGNGFITAFLAKFDVNGNLLWVNSVIDNNSTTSNNYIYPQELTIDNNNDIIVFGSLRGSSVDADPGTGVSMISNNNNSEAIFVSKFNASGNFIWSKTVAYGTSILSGIDPQSVDVDSQNNIFLTGIFRRTIQFTATDSITSVNAVNLSLYVIKLDPLGNFLWAKTPNTSSIQNQYSIGYSIHIDNSDNVMITGYFYGDVDFDLGGGIHTVTSAAAFPDADLYVLKLDNNGNFIWVKNYGNPNGRLLGIDINIDATGNIIIAGALSGFPTNITDIDPSTATLNINNGGGYESFVLKLDANGNNMWVKNIAANTAQTELFNVATDNCGNIYSIGRFKGTCDFDPGTAVFNMTSGFQNIFISKLDSAGNFVWAHNFGEGSTFADKDNDIFIDNNSSIYFTAGMGVFTSTTPSAADFDPGVGTQMLTTNGQSDIVVSKLIDCCTPTIAQPINFIGSTTFCNGDSIILDAGAGYSNYQWLPTNDTTQTITVSSSGNYAVIVSDNCGTDTSQVVVVTVNSSSSSNQTFTECQGFSITVGTNTYNTSGTYIDTLATTLGCDSIITTNLTINTPSTTSQTFNECEGFSITVGSNTYNTSGIFIDTLTTTLGCDSIITTNLTINTPITTSQTFNECEGFSITVGTNTYSTTGVYTDIVNNCDTITTHLTIRPTPFVTFSKIDDNCGESIGAITSNLVTGTPPITYVWSNGANSPNLNNLLTDTYIVSIADSLGCNYSGSVFIADLQLNCNFHIYLPNVFSPNGDGNNDTFKVLGKGVKSIHFIIYNRWGNKVFESNNINSGWDGKYKGVLQNSGVYVYYVSAILNNDKNVTEKGKFNLIK